MEDRSFKKTHRIRFSECDPAGIVFYPQYFVMFNDLLEAWVDVMLPEGFAGLIGRRKVGMPSVRLEADFRSISQMGDEVVLNLAVERLGSRSITLRLWCVGTDGVLRMSLRQVIVTTSLETHEAIEVPSDLRRAMEAYVLSDAFDESLKMG